MEVRPLSSFIFHQELSLHFGRYCLQILFSTTLLWFKISTIKIPKENAKRPGMFGEGDMHRGWHPCAWKDAKRTRRTTWSSFNKIEPRHERIFKATIEVRGPWSQRSRNRLRSRKDCSYRKDGEVANVAELRKFMGMINRQQKFIANLSEKTMPLRGLFSSKNEWHWGQPQEESFSRGWRKTWSKRQLSLVTAPRKKLSYLRTPRRIN